MTDTEQTQSPLGCISCHVKMASVRGLCTKCYEIIRRRVLAGDISWEKLESQGRCLPRKKSYRHRNSTSTMEQLVPRKKGGRYTNDGQLRCMICDEPTRVRGVCYHHYCVLCHRVKRGLVSWQQLEERKLCLPPTPRSRYQYKKAGSHPRRDSTSQLPTKVNGRCPHNKEDGLCPICEKEERAIAMDDSQITNEDYKEIVKDLDS